MTSTNNMHFNYKMMLKECVPGILMETLLCRSSTHGGILYRPLKDGGILCKLQQIEAYCVLDLQQMHL